jgi:hypothetical protein
MTNYLVRMPQQLKSSRSDYSSKIKKLTQKALTSPSMLSTADTRELGASVLACIASKMRAHPRGSKATKKAPTRNVTAVATKTIADLAKKTTVAKKMKSPLCRNTGF